MRFAVVLTSLLVSVIASPLALPNIKRDASSITAAIGKITNSVVTLNTTLNRFEPNILLNGIQALKIQKQTDAIGNSLVDATKVAASSQPLNADESSKVAAAVLDFQPKIFSLLDNLQRREPVFKKAILGLVSVEPLVYRSLQRQKQLSSSFGTTVADKLSEPFKGFAPVINGQISDAFDKAIAAFAS